MLHVPSAFVGAVCCGIVVQCLRQRKRKHGKKQEVFSMEPGDVNRVVVYASSSTIVDNDYVVASRELGREIARRGWVQTNGGSAVGLMGAATDGGLDENGVVDMVILDRFLSFRHQGVREVHVAHAMPERKRGLYERGNAFFSLPGGLGTLEEAMEVLSWRQLGFHDKPSVFINTNGFYNHLDAMLTDLMEGGFLSKELRHAYLVTADIKEACDFVAAYSPTHVDKQKIWGDAVAMGSESPDSPPPQADWQAAAPHALSAPSR